MKASIVGIDNTGKTSIVKSLRGTNGLETIHLTDYRNSSSRIARTCGRLVNRLAQFGEYRNARSLTGFAYLLHLGPYFFEERTKDSQVTLVSDRDPIIDTLCYSDFYLPNGYSRIIRPSLKLFLEHTFNYPTLVFYLEVSPEVAARRCHVRRQLHERSVHDLARLRDLFDEEVSKVQRVGVPVVKIDTDTRPIKEVANEIVYNLARKS